MDPDAKRLLDSLRSAEPPGESSVDVHQAVRSGRRRIRRRKAVSSAAVAATVVAVIAVPVALNRLLPWSGHQNPVGAAASFDVWRRAFTVGSAGGFTPDTYETGRFRQQVTLRPEVPGGPVQATQASVTMYAKGRLPYRDGRRWEPGGESAPAVNGHRAYWVKSPTGVELAWEWTSGGWGFVALAGPGADRTRANVVAQSAHPVTGAPVPVAGDAVTVPFTIARTPVTASNRLIGVRTTYGAPHQPRVAVLRFAAQDPPEPPAGEVAAVTVGVQNPPPTGVTANTTIGGHPANVQDTKVVILDIGSGYAAVAESAQASAERLKELATSVSLLANPDDPAAGTRDPLR